MSTDVSALPPRPTEGGSFLLDGGEWIRIQPAPVQPVAEPQPSPEPEAPADDVLHAEASDPGQV